MTIKAIVTSRITQLLVRAVALVAACVAAKYGVTLEEVGPGEIAAISSAVAYGCDVLIHRIRYGVWLWHPDAPPGQ